MHGEAGKQLNTETQENSLEAPEASGQSADKKRVRISVRNLVEFILRYGDIDNRHGGPGEREAMQEGSRIHRKIQGQMGAGYQAEVPLSMDFEYDSFVLTVEGRADGIFSKNRDQAMLMRLTGRQRAKAMEGQLGLGELLAGRQENPEKKTETSCVFIDEIKGVYRELSSMNEPYPLHVAQAKCYAYIYAHRKGLQEIGVQMTYCNLETEEVRRFPEIFPFEELKEWFEELVSRYRKWAEYQVEWKRIRQESIRKVEFPFPWRPGQKDVSAGVYRTILRKKKLFIQAPTGTGKTISTIFPAVKAVGEGIADRIFYMTAKTITRTVAEEAFAILRKQELRMKVLTLTAKEKICFCEETECNPEHCPYARGHYDRVNDAVFEMITETDVFSREAVAAQAEKWQVCPFEFSLDLSLWIDTVICDYNYVFDPQAKLKRFFAEGSRGDYLFLIDEAHNLVERGREMFSASLYKEDFLDLKRLVRLYSNKISRALERCNRYLLGLKREMDEKEYRILEDVGILPVHLMNLCGAIEVFFEDERSGRRKLYAAGETGEDRAAGAQQDPVSRAELNKKILDMYFQAKAFLDVCDRLDDNYVIYTEHCADGRFMIRLYCVDISKNLQECLDKGKSTIYFSATLLPVTYYKSLLSTVQDDYAIYAQSSFDPNRKQVLIGTDTSSRYTNRTEEEYRKMARYVLETVQAKRGNYMVFFSSYRMMEDVARAFEALCETQGISLFTGGEMKRAEAERADGTAEVQCAEAEQADGTDAPECGDRIELICQTSGMNEEAREAFLEKFGEARSGNLVGFCVMGGIFGEGIDLKNDRLIGAILVGTGLPQVCNEREILKNFYDARGEDGFFYAYLCPGMNKVLQSAGRVIRTDEDEGVILLLDERFAAARYRRMFPAEWENLETCTVASVREKTRRFWNKRGIEGGMS